ncbi:MAG: CBS domain-containing protein, partial [Candidatus Heimdallarchaeota archaeon]
GYKKHNVLYPVDTVDTAMSILYRSDVGRLAVLDSPETKNLVGIVSNSDVLKCLEMQRIKDLEVRKIADKRLAEIELQMVEQTIKDFPELAEKVRVIRRDKKQIITEKQLLDFLRDSCKDIKSECKIEEEYKEYIKKNKKRRTKRKRNKKNPSSEDS